ncbi:MAG TPA: sulfotransferase domain-containing protein [Caulobacteraceae bacterium]|nr:sulfotransferase domain-containing protein [Caulobacteraceae bacterium]
MDAIAPRRARSMKEWGEIRQRMARPEDFPEGIKSYRPRPTDIVITPFGKCGTTWLQQTFHTLRTRGDMDFDDISRVVPWIETAKVVGIDLEAPQRAEPRGFKSHLAYSGHPEIPKGAKYVVSFRDPKDALVSMHKFMEGWFLEPGAISLADFAEPWLASGDFWKHLLSWWAERDNPNVLIFSYEGMTADPEGSIRRLAAFCGIPLDDELLALTLERSSIGYMLAHKDRFDDFLMREVSERRCNLPPGSDSAKVRQGGVGGHKTELTPELAAKLDAKWAELVAPVTGFADYAALEAAVRALA